MNTPTPLELRTVETAVYETLRDFIVRGEYPPGKRLHLANIARDLGVSTMPIRGAITRLADEGLVSVLPRRGATVSPMDLEEYLELQDLRMGIESAAARYGVLNMDDVRLAEMKRVLEELRREDDLENCLALEWDAYIALYSARGRQRTIDLVLEYGRMTERYMRFAMDVFVRRRELAVNRLEKVIESCERGDADRVVDLLLEDLRHDELKVKEALSQREESK